MLPPAMNPDHQRCAIAEACGWKAPGDCTRQPPHAWQSPLDGCCYDNLPDYLADLNAMHEAEAALTTWQQEVFGGFLYHGKVCAFQDVCTGQIVFGCAHATAARRAEAFLRATGRWVEE